MDVYELVGRAERSGVVPYSLRCTECGTLTPGVTTDDGWIDMDVPLDCGHEPSRRDLVLTRETPYPV